ncbi:MAG: mechanosensitive ion channel domain-containing protein [Cyanobium sp.]|nr:mechanosensitive ion channel domain-containing protein [Cyanobium sp.]
MNRTRWRTRPAPLLTAVLTALLAMALVVLNPLAAPGADRSEPLAPPPQRLIPIEAQPFYPELMATAQRWDDAPLGQVVGDSPRDTLLNFYAVMARVQHDLELVTAHPQRDPGWRWSPAALRRIRNAEELFAQAVEALDSSVFPESVRTDMANEAAMQLKEVLDYVFSHSTVPITIPDAAGMKQLNSSRSQPSQSWTLPNTAITLAGEEKPSEINAGFQFTGGTVRQIGRMYDQIRLLPGVPQPYATPGLYTGYITTPGYLAAPKWYLRLPPTLRRVLEMELQGQTLLQIAAAFTVLLLYGWLVRQIARRLLHTYRHWRFGAQSNRRRLWLLDDLAWKRVLLTLPVLPLTWLSKTVIDDSVNVTGAPLLVVTYLFFIAYFLAAGFFFFFLFEALGRSLSEWLVRLRGGGSELQLRRVSNLVMPVSRVLGALVAMVMIYRLLIVLGLPSATVLAFSAVPGLAIGLGASKLLGNLFGGLSIQTDRPVRVGEFCRIGENLGFVSRIGLRSLELETLESRVTIPNAIADEETIVNFSRRQPGSDAPPTQSLAVRLAVNHRFSPEQVADLLHFARLAVQAIDGLQQPLVSLEQQEIDNVTLLCHGLVAAHAWQPYLAARERLLQRLEEVVEQVRLCQRQIGVSYDTGSEQLRRLPTLIAGVVGRDPLLALQSCRLMTISDFSYDFVFRLHSHHASFGAFKDAINRLNQDLLACLAAEGIEIPYPTAVEIQKEA